MRQTKREHIGTILDRLPLCGCGCPDTVLELYRDVIAMASTQQRAFGWGESMADKSMAWLAMYVLDKAGLTEHGGGITGAWPTEDGNRVLAFLRATNCDSNLFWDANTESLNLEQLGPDLQYEKY